MNTDTDRIVAGLDVHKDSVYLCIMHNDCDILYEKKFGVLTTEIREMRCIMVSMESWKPLWKVQRCTGSRFGTSL